MVAELVGLWRLELAVLSRMLSFRVPRELLHLLLRKVEVDLWDFEGMLFVEEGALVSNRLISWQDGVDLLQSQIILVIQTRLLRGEVRRHRVAIGLPLTRGCSVLEG